MPMVATYATARRYLSPPSVLEVDDLTVKTWLPSTICASDRQRLMSSENTGFLITAEKALRVSQINDTLVSVKRLLTKEYQRRNLFGQRSATRARLTLSRLDKRIKDHADGYRRAYYAMLLLEPPGSWTSTYLPFHKDDIQHGVVMAAQVAVASNSTTDEP